MKYGIAHVVWEDENFDSAQWCIDNAEKYASCYGADVDAVVIESLKMLLLVDSKYTQWPREYENAGSDANPADYPPPSDWEMVPKLLIEQVVLEMQGQNTVLHTKPV